MVCIVRARDDTDDVDMRLTSRHCQDIAFKDFVVGIKFYENLKYGLYFRKKKHHNSLYSKQFVYLSLFAFPRQGVFLDSE